MKFLGFFNDDPEEKNEIGVAPKKLTLGRPVAAKVEELDEGNEQLFGITKISDDGEKLLVPVGGLVQIGDY